MPSIEQVASGTQTATLDVEHSLDVETSAEVYVLVVNLANLTTGDVVVLRVKPKVLSGGSAALAFEQAYSGPQTEDVVYSEPVPSAHSVTFTLEQTDGTGRAFEWSVLRVV